MVNTGKDYELFVADIQKALLHAEDITVQKNIVVEVDKKIIDRNGIERQFDIYWEYDLGGFTYKTVIECKDYASNVSVDKIDALIGKTCDIPDLKAVFATKKGYQSGAKIKADKHKVDLLIVREQNDSDWVTEDGELLIKHISVKLEVILQNSIISFNPIIDARWVEDNTDYVISSIKPSSAPSNEIFIEDTIIGERYSLQELVDRLEPLDGQSHGTFKRFLEFDNAFFYHENKKLKLMSYEIEYFIPKKTTNLIEIDLSKELVGVIEYLQKGTKKSIFRDGIIR